MLQAEILDLPGVGSLEAGIPRLKDRWNFTPHFQGDKDHTLREAVIHNLSRSVLSYYFVRKTHLNGDISA